MSRCSKTTTTRLGSGKLSRAKHVVRQRLQPNLSPDLCSLWGLWLFSSCCPQNCSRKVSQQRAAGVSLSLVLAPGWPAAVAATPSSTLSSAWRPPGQSTTGKAEYQSTPCLMFPGHGVITTWWPDGFQTWFSFYFFCGLINYTQCIELYAGGYTFTYVYTCVASTQKIPEFPSPQDALCTPPSQLPSPPQGQPLFCFLSLEINFGYSWTPCQWNHTLCALLGLASHAVYYICESQPC